MLAEQLMGILDCLGVALSTAILRHEVPENTDIIGRKENYREDRTAALPIRKQRFSRPIVTIGSDPRTGMGMPDLHEFYQFVLPWKEHAGTREKAYEKEQDRTVTPSPLRGNK